MKWARTIATSAASAQLASMKCSAVAGSLVFTMTEEPVDLKDFSRWWKWTPVRMEPSRRSGQQS